MLSNKLILMISKLFFILTLGLLAISFAQDDNRSFSELNYSEQQQYQTKPAVNKTIEISAKNCLVSYKDNVTVRALDNNLEPVEGVAVSTKHQISATTGRGYYTSPTKYSDENGLVKFALTNLETEEKNLDCRIDISASIGEVIEKRTINATSHPQYIDFIFDVATATINVIDQNNRPLQGALVSAGNNSKVTNEEGIVKFKLLKGKQIVFVKYLNQKIERTFDLTNNTDIYMEIGIYDAIFRVMDDNGKFLTGTLEFNGKEYQTDENGEIEIKQIVGANQNLVVTHSGIRKTIQADISYAPATNIVFDFTSPDITIIGTKPEAQSIRIFINVTDRGRYASGIPLTGFIAKYKIGDDGWKSATIIPRESGLFIVEIPLQQEGTLVDFSFEATDRDGNKQVVNARYTAESPTSGVEVPASESETVGTMAQQKDEFPLIPIIGGFIILSVVILVFYVIFRLKTKEGV